jgi:hypothetical protein
VLKEVRKKCVIGFVGGSDLVKQQEQLGVGGRNGSSFLFIAWDKVMLTCIVLCSHRRFRLCILGEWVNGVQTRQTTRFSVVH